jgi:hypothetical protein
MKATITLDEFTNDVTPAELTVIATDQMVILDNAIANTPVLSLIAMQDYLEKVARTHDPIRAVSEFVWNALGRGRYPDFRGIWTKCPGRNRRDRRAR